MTVVKVCSMCGESLPLESFSPNGNGLLRASCKSCSSRRHREDYAKDPEKYRASGRASRQKHRNKRRASFSAWYAANKESVRLYQLQNKETITSQNKARRAANPEQVREWRRHDWQKHRDANLAKARERYASNPEEYAARNRDNYLKNSAEYKSRARARQKSLSGRYTQPEVDAIYSAQYGMCAGCRTPLGKKYEIDHVMPVSLGGSNTAANLQLLCTLCNRRKGAMHPDDWAARLGKLFV